MKKNTTPDGMILSDRRGEVTTVWRDGEVIRADCFGRLSVQQSTRPIRDPEPQEEPVDL